MRSPFTLLQSALNCLGCVRHRSSIVVMPASLRRRSIRLPTPGIVSIGRRNRGWGMCSGGQIVTPLGLSTLQAIFARSRLAAKPMEQVIWLPIFFAMRL